MATDEKVCRLSGNCACAGLYYTYPKDREEAAKAAQMLARDGGGQSLTASGLSEETRGLLVNDDNNDRVESHVELAPLRQEAFLNHK
jgi:hypothetical protein